MAITISISKTKKPARGHSKCLPAPDLAYPGRLRVGHLMSLYRLSHSSIYTYLRRNWIPAPDGKMGSRPYWLTKTILEDLEKKVQLD